MKNGHFRKTLLETIQKNKSSVRRKIEAFQKKKLLRLKAGSNPARGSTTESATYFEEK